MLLHEVLLSVPLLLFGFIGGILQLFHQLDLVCQSFPPKLLPFVELFLPVSQFRLQLFDVFGLVVVDSQVILLFLFEQPTFPLGLQLSHLVFRQLFGEIDDGKGGFISIGSPEFFL